MTGTTSPGTEGPTFAPPHLPPGWIAQWDGASRKYYFVQLSTGVSQWETPTEAAPAGSTPAQNREHPYGVPQQQELITHPDGSQTVRHSDGSLEPVNPPMPPDGTKGMDGPNGDRGLGSMAMNALMNGKNGNNDQGASPLGKIAGHFMGGGNQGGHSGGGGGGGTGGHNALGKIGGALASSFLNSGDKPDQPQNYHGGPPSASQQPQQHGMAGSVMGGVANMFGGNKPHGNNQDFGYSNSGGGGGGYDGPAPPATYQAPNAGNGPSPGSGGHSYHAPSQQHQSRGYPPSTGQGQNAPYEHQPHPPASAPAYGHAPQGPPPSQSQGPPMQHSYGQNPQYGGGGAPHPQPAYGGGGGYPGQYGNGPPGGYPGAHPGGQPAYANGPPHQGHGGYGPRY